MHTLSIGDCIRFGWETFKQRPWILIGAFVLAMIIARPARAYWTATDDRAGRADHPPPPSVFGAIVAFVSIVVSVLVGLGLTTFSLRAHDNIQGVQIADLWNPAPFWRVPRRPYSLPSSPLCFGFHCV